MSVSESPLAAPARRFVPGEVIVKYRDSADARLRDTAPAIRGYSAQVVKPLSGGARLMKVKPERSLVAPSVAEEEASTLAAIEALRANPDVEYAHENLYLEFSAVPSDPLYPRQWHYPAINLPQAWDRVTGNVIIAVLDSGRTQHPDLAGVWTAGFDFGDNDADPTTNGTYHHGLHVAGILAARTNSGEGGAGVCWGCQLMPVKLSRADNSFNTGTTMDILGQAIRWAVDNGARVINMSIANHTGTQQCTSYPFLQGAVDYAIQRNVVVVASAGNGGRDVANVVPASCVGVIAVAGSDPNGVLTNLSNRGARIDVVAPGGGGGYYGEGINCPPDPNTRDIYAGTQGIVSAWAIARLGPELGVGDYCYRYMTGTSMAAPHVSGLAALLLTQNPSLTPAQVAARIRQTARPINGCTGCGAGLIDAFAATYPNLPAKPFKGLWWNPARSGNGLDIQHLNDGSLSLTWFTYTSAGVPIWYASTLTADATGWAGSLFRYSWNGASATGQVVGTARVALSGGVWRYSWTLGGLSGSEPIQQMAFGAGNTAMSLSGSWYNAAQPGWGMSFATQGTTHIGTLTFYQGSSPTWVQGVVNSAATSLTFPMSYVTGTNLCPGCTGTPSTTSQSAGTFSVWGGVGIPSAVTATSQVSFPGGTWTRSAFTLSRLTPP